MGQIRNDHRRIIATIAPDEAHDVIATRLSQSIAMGAEIKARHPDYFRP